MMDEKMRQLTENRRGIYRLLGRLYIKEVDETLLKQLKAMAFPCGCADEELEEGYRLLENCLKGITVENLDDLAVDYARIFLSAGVAQGMAAFPYESVYTSKKRLMMQDARNSVAALYGAEGLKPGKDMFRAPEDHVGLELEFMAHLCEKEMAGIPSLKEQQSFCKAHLFNWIYVFTSEVVKYAQTDFYKALGKITRGFMNMERSFLDSQLLEEQSQK